MFAPAFPPTNGEETWLSVLDDSWESAGTILSAKDDDEGNNLIRVRCEMVMNTMNE